MQCSSNLTMPEKRGGACSNEDFDLGVGLRLCISSELPCAAAGPESCCASPWIWPGGTPRHHRADECF